MKQADRQKKPVQPARFTLGFVREAKQDSAVKNLKVCEALSEFQHDPSICLPTDGVLFANRKVLQHALSAEAEGFVKEGSQSHAVQLLVWQGRVIEAIQLAIRTQSLTEEIIALSPAGW